MQRGISYQIWEGLYAWSANISIWGKKFGCNHNLPSILNEEEKKFPESQQCTESICWQMTHYRWGGGGGTIALENNQKFRYIGFF